MKNIAKLLLPSFAIVLVCGFNTTYPSCKPTSFAKKVQRFIQVQKEIQTNIIKSKRLFEECVEEVAKNPNKHEADGGKIYSPYKRLSEDINSYNAALTNCIKKYKNNPRDCYKALIPFYGKLVEEHIKLFSADTSDDYSALPGLVVKQGSYGLGLCGEGDCRRPVELFIDVKPHYLEKEL